MVFAFGFVYVFRTWSVDGVVCDLVSQAEKRSTSHVQGQAAASQFSVVWFLFYYLKKLKVWFECGFLNQMEFCYDTDVLYSICNLNK